MLAATEVQRLAAAAWDDGWGRDDPTRLAERMASAGNRGRWSGNVQTELMRAANRAGLSEALPKPYYFHAPGPEGLWLCCLHMCFISIARMNHSRNADETHVPTCGSDVQVQTRRGFGTCATCRTRCTRTSRRTARSPTTASTQRSCEHLQMGWVAWCNIGAATQMFRTVPAYATRRFNVERFRATVYVTLFS